MRTLTPDDIPFETLGTLTQSLRAEAERAVEFARERLTAGDLNGAVARYEAALARWAIAERVEQAAHRVAARVATTHESRLRAEEEADVAEALDQMADTQTE